MKQRILFIALLLCSCLSGFAQAKSLVVDCQTPGWLSSKINYEDQLSVEELKVSGYLNNTDLVFLGTLNKNKLQDLDMTDATMTEVVNKNPFGNSTTDQFVWNTLALPRKWTEKALRSVTIKINGVEYQYSVRDSWKGVSINTLIMGGPEHHIIDSREVSAKYLVLREGTDSIMPSLGWKKLLHVEFPQSLKFIGSAAFIDNTNLSNIVFPDNIDYIGDNAFKNTAYKPDTLRLPSPLVHYYMTSFPVKENQVIMLGDNLKYISNQYSVYVNNSYYQYHNYLTKNQIAAIYIKTTTPPRVYDKSGAFETERSGFSLQDVPVYVPRGTKDAYLSADGWKYANIIENIEIEGLKITEEGRYHIGDRHQMNVLITPEDAVNKDLIWQSSNESVASISNEGELCALSFGSSTLTVSSKLNGVSDILEINVYEHTTGISVDDILTICIGEKQKLYAQTLPLNRSDNEIVFSSDDEDIATVDENGVVRGLARGTCVITATSVDGGYSAQCTVSVMQPVESLILDNHTLSLKVGETQSLHATISPGIADNKKIQWVSRDEAIAAVDGSGLVTAKKAGSTFVVAISDDNSEICDSCIVSINQPVTGITLEPSEMTIKGIGKSVQLVAHVLPEDASNKDVVWLCPTPAVCVVSNGTVVSTGFGTAVVIATTVDGGLMATCLITVEEEEKPIAVGDVNGDGEVNATDLACIVNVLAGLESNETYEGRADVNADGQVTASDIAEVVNILAGLS